MTMFLAAQVYIYENCTESNTCTCTPTLRMCKTGEVCVGLVEYINVRFLVVICTIVMQPVTTVGSELRLYGVSL